MTTDTITLSDPQPTIARGCGAIALAEVLHRFGVSVNLASIWDYVALDDPFGTKCAKSYRMASFAIRHGIQAIVLKCNAQRAWDALSHCHTLGLSVICNHQSRSARNEGHYSTLLSISKTSLLASDPILRKRVEWSRDDFLDHWGANTETTGNVLVAFGNLEPGDVMPESTHCPSCSSMLHFQPSSIFDPNDWGDDGLWQSFYCHGCDACFSLKR